MTSPTQLTLKWLRKMGFSACVVEQTIRGKGMMFKRDAFGFADILAMRENEGILLVQVTDHTSRSKHRVKILENEFAPHWLRSGGRIMLVTWGKGQGRGKPRTHHHEELTLDDFTTIEVRPYS